MKTNVNKTNVSIKFNSIEEYREIEKKLIELGYVNDKEWNNGFIMNSLIRKLYEYYYILIYQGTKFEIHNHKGDEYTIKSYYNSLEEFLKDCIKQPPMTTIPIEDYNRLRKLEIKEQIKKLKKEYDTL